jgi:hypothetical protein
MIRIGTERGSARSSGRKIGTPFKPSLRGPRKSQISPSSSFARETLQSSIGTKRKGTRYLKPYRSRSHRATGTCCTYNLKTLITKD